MKIKHLISVGDEFAEVFTFDKSFSSSQRALMEAQEKSVLTCQVLNGEMNGPRCFKRFNPDLLAIEKHLFVLED